MKDRAFIGCAIAFLAGVTSSALSGELKTLYDFNVSKDSFEQQLDRDFEGRIVDDQYEIVWKSESGRLSTLSFTEPDNPTVSADVAVKPKPKAAGKSGIVHGAGLVIRHDNSESGRSFFMLVLEADRYVIKAFSGGGFSQTLSGKLAKPVAGHFVKLSARETKTGAEFFVDGVKVGALADSGVKGRGVGLIVLGEGTYRFDNVALVNKVKPE